MTTKAELKKLCRQRMKSRLELLRPFDSAYVKERLRENLKLVMSRHPGVWGTYHPLPFEADPLIGAVAGVEWVFPRMTGESLTFHRGEAFLVGAFGITEPHASSEVIAPAMMTGVLVPGLAFDLNGGRLGRGKGFYDRALSSFGGLTVGIAFSAQLIEQVPMEKWDVPLDAIVTEESVY